MSKKEKKERYIGCCGAYCKTCRQFVDGFCKGCKLGYETKKRDINRAKCKIKICCFKEKNLETCADCQDFKNCEIVDCFYKKNREKYKHAIEFIKINKYPKFIKIADNWKDASGKLK